MRIPIMTVIYINYNKGGVQPAYLLPRYILYEISCFKIRKLVIIGEQMD